MKRIIQTLKKLFSEGKYTETGDAANIIRRFVQGTSRDPYEWDDFETQNEDNPESAVALELCWFFAKKFPPEKRTEYCGPKAFAYFLKIADVLENDDFRGLNHEAIIGLLRKNKLPEEVSAILGISEP